MAGAMFFANFAAYTYIGPLLHARAGRAPARSPWSCSGSAWPALPQLHCLEAPQFRPASRAGKHRHRRTARPVEQEPAHTEHADVTVRGHTDAATRKEGTAMPNYEEELPCPTRW